MSLYDAPHTAQSPKRLLLTVLLCGLVLLGGDWLTQRYFGHRLLGSITPVVMAPVAATTATAPLGGISGGNLSTTLTAPAVRVALGNARAAGYINLNGGALDTLTLKAYKNEITDPAGYPLFTPASVSPSVAEYLQAGWQGAGVEGPTHTTTWQLEAPNNATQQAADKVVLSWRNSTGQSFTRTWQAKPDSYLWQVTERVVNTAALPVTLTPYAQVVRHGGYVKAERSNWVNYFGPMGQLQTPEGLLLKEQDFADVKKQQQSEVWQGTGGWWGITSQYFVAALIPPQATTSARQFAYRTEATPTGGSAEVYTAGAQFAPQVVAAAGGAAEVTYQVYAGPKHAPMLREAGVGLEQAIAWGWFEPLVKGLYTVITALHKLVESIPGAWANSWGIAVIALTLLLKIVTFPLANTSYRAMAKMKKLQPEVEALKKKMEGNQQGMAMAMMQLYKDKKVNPLSGCWPMLIQIPIFFAMYKVVLVMFEFRHASFLWMPDLAVHDPFYILPVLMGLSMYVQFKLNPKPTDPAQEIMFKYMPLLMTLMFLWFPAGLVLYWFTNNLLSIGQQYWMMKREKAI